MVFTKTKIATAILAAVVSNLALADIKIGVIGPYTGGSQAMGISLRGGVKLAAAEINSNGGLLGGQKIVLVEYDDKATPGVGGDVAKAAINNEKVIAGIGYANTGVAIKGTEVFQKAGIPIIITTASGTVLTQAYKNEPVNYVFRMAAPDALQTQLVVNQVVNVQKARKVAIFADSTAYGSQGLEQLLLEMKAANIQPVLVERFAPGKTDFTDAALKARTSGVDAVITWCLAPEASAIKIAFNRVGLRTPFAGSWTLSLKTYSDNAGPITNGTKTTATFSLDTERKTGQKFLKNYSKFFNVRDIPSSLSGAQAYDGMYLLATAIKQANSTDPKKIAAALEDLKTQVDGAVQTYNKPFSKTNHEAIDSTSKISIGTVKNGDILVKPDSK